MEKVMKKLTDSVVDKISMDFLRNQVLKNAYGNDDTVIAKLDPRILLVWYVFFALAPWFVDNLVFLLGCFRTDPWIVDIYFGMVLSQLANNVNNPGIA